MNYNIFSPKAILLNGQDRMVVIAKENKIGIALTNLTAIDEDVGQSISFSFTDKQPLFEIKDGILKVRYWLHFEDSQVDN